MSIVTETREFRGQMILSLDGVTWLRVLKKHFAKLPLEIGQEVEPEQYIDQLAALQYKDCYEAALTMLDRSVRTRSEIAQALVRKGFVSPVAQAVVERLSEIGLLDDMRYAQRLAEIQSAKPVGAYAMRRKLQAKRFDAEAIDAAMEQFDEAQQAQACRLAAAKLWRKYAQLPSREGRAKLSQALARRGFGWDAIASAVDEIVSDAGDAFE